MRAVVGLALVLFLTGCSEISIQPNPKEVPFEAYRAELKFTR